MMLVTRVCSVTIANSSSTCLSANAIESCARLLRPVLLVLCIASAVLNICASVVIGSGI